MKRTILVGLLLAIQPYAAGAAIITYYADGALVEQEATAVNGIVTIPLQAGAIESSLRVAPQTGTVIRRVETIPAAGHETGGRTLEELREKRSRMEDRLKALTVREEIFTAAAKSQSGKAPRRSKTNPDPLQSIRQGTEFAIAQLEAVYTARRAAEQEIKRLDARITAAGGFPRASEKAVRIAVSTKGGKVTVRYAISGITWSPRYDILLVSDSTARINLYGDIPEGRPGDRRFAAPGTLAANPGARFPASSDGTSVLLGSYAAVISRPSVSSTPLPSFSFELTNATPDQLTAGPAAVYHRGEYLGKVRFDSLSSGGTRKITSGQ